jgi:RNA polymerase sigma-70 factor (ECF subfamily)
MDSDLLGNLLDQHAAALALYARQWCNAPEDVVQEAFLKLAGLRALPEHPAAWLFKVVRHKAIDLGIAARRRSRHETVAASRAGAWFEADPQGHADLVDAEQAAAELNLLPIEEREVIIAHLWGGLTFEQIADVSGSSSSSAHRLYSRGLSTLRDRLGVSCHKSRPSPSQAKSNRRLPG